MLGQAPQTGLDLHWFILLFVTMWLGISVFLSLAGGWHRLGKQYRSTRRIKGKLFSFASMSMGNGIFPVNYNGCLFVRIGTDGIEISIFLPFKLLSPRLLIPWNAVAECRQESFWFRKCTAIYLSEPRSRMRFYGRVGRDIYRAYAFALYHRPKKTPPDL